MRHIRTVVRPRSTVRWPSSPATASGPAEQPTVDDNTAADAGRDRQVDVVGDAPRGTEFAFCECGNLRVALKTRLDAQLVLQRWCQAKAPQLAVEVGRIDQYAGQRIERAGCRDAQGEWLVHTPGNRFVTRGPKRVDRAVDHRVRGLGRCLGSSRDERAAGQADSSAQLGAAEVECEDGSGGHLSKV